MPGYYEDHTARGRLPQGTGAAGFSGKRGPEQESPVGVPALAGEPPKGGTPTAAMPELRKLVPAYDFAGRSGRDDAIDCRRTIPAANTKMFQRGGGK